jgi:hypothetical protein
LSSTNKSALKQTVLGAKYLIYDPFKNQEQKVNIAASFFQLASITGGICFAGANFTMKTTLIFFSLCQYFTKSHADYSKSSG